MDGVCRPTCTVVGVLVACSVVFSCTLYTIVYFENMEKVVSRVKARLNVGRRHQ